MSGDFIDTTGQTVTRTRAPEPSPQREGGGVMWQPIETAPIGQMLVALVSGRLAIVQSMAVSSTTVMGDRVWIDQAYRESVAPTHWMPLPEAPTHD